MLMINSLAVLSRKGYALTHDQMMASDMLERCSSHYFLRQDGSSCAVMAPKCLFDIVSLFCYQSRTIASYTDDVFRILLSSFVSSEASLTSYWKMNYMIGMLSSFGVQVESCETLSEESDLSFN